MGSQNYPQRLWRIRHIPALWGYFLHPALAILDLSSFHSPCFPALNTEIHTLPHSLIEKGTADLNNCFFLGIFGLPWWLG